MPLVDGHWALVDYLDEPHLAVGARDGRPTRRVAAAPRVGRRWMVRYGAASLAGGLVALVVAAALMWWSAVEDLATALFTGNPAEIVIGLVLVTPITASLLGPIIDLIPTDDQTDA